LGLTGDQVVALRAQDPVLATIAVQGKRLNFAWLRSRAGEDRGLHDELLKGRKILVTVTELEQYLYSYGKMICSQWEVFASQLTATPEPTSYIDYGCGQGLAGLLLHERLGPDFSASWKRVVLIEPSPAALVRAEAVYRAIAPEAELVCIHKSFDEVVAEDLDGDAGLPRLHIYSNVLDIPGFAHTRLFLQGLALGKNTVLAVGNDRNDHGGTAHLLEVEALLDHPEYKKHFQEKTSEISQFKCGDDEKFFAVSWFAKFEVVNG
jgi:hypothetical protein